MIGVNGDQFLSGFVQHQLLIRLGQVEGGETLSSRQGSEDILWLWNGMLVHLQCSIQGDLKITTQAESTITFGNRHIGCCPTTKLHLLQP